MKYLLGIDNGGSDIKCALFDVTGKQIAAVATQVAIQTPGAGFTQRDAEEVWMANVQVIRDCIGKSGIAADDIAAVGITAYGNGLVFVDERIRPVYPAIVSTDDRAGDLVREFKGGGTE